MPRKREDTGEHGVYAYRFLKCRCETCKAIVAEQRAKYRAPSPDGKKNYSVRYGSSSLRLPAGPLVEFLEKNGYVKDFDRSVISRWRRETMSIYVIDKYCIKYGTHPYLIYGDAFYGDMAQEDAA